MENRERSEPRERGGDGRPGNWNERERQQPRRDQPTQRSWELEDGGWQGQQGGYRQQGGGYRQQDFGQQWDYEQPNRGYGQQGFDQRSDYDQQDRGNRQQGAGYQSGYGQQTGRNQGWNPGWNQGGGMQGRNRMQEPRGRFHGKGPRNYRRSDDRIREEVCDLLTEHGEIDASSIEITVANGEVTLKGTVPDRQMKRMAEDIVENVSSVKEINNNLRVQQHQGKEHGKENEEEMEMAGRSSQSDRSGKSSKQS